MPIIIAMTASTLAKAIGTGSVLHMPMSIAVAIGISDVTAISVVIVKATIDVSSMTAATSIAVVIEKAPRATLVHGLGGAAMAPSSPAAMGSGTDIDFGGSVFVTLFICGLLAA
jgi:hypothetical protein